MIAWPSVKIVNTQNTSNINYIFIPGFHPSKLVNVFNGTILSIHRYMYNMKQDFTGEINRSTTKNHTTKKLSIN